MPAAARKRLGRYGIDRVHASPEAMLQDPDLDVIYIASPHDSHHAWMKAAVQAGKHVLCEKAITLNARQLAEVVLLARAQGVVVAEAMTIYHMPLYRRLRALVDSGALGRVRLVQVNFGSWRVLDPQSRFFSRDLAGGALLDIGVYATAFARWFLDSAPHQVLTTVEMAPTGVDDQSGIILKNDRNQLVVMARRAISRSMSIRAPTRPRCTGRTRRVRKRSARAGARMHCATRWRTCSITLTLARVRATGCRHRCGRRVWRRRCRMMRCGS